LLSVLGTGCCVMPDSRDMMLPLRVRRDLCQGENARDAASCKLTSENPVKRKSNFGEDPFYEVG
jgi:hypothetical protein